MGIELISPSLLQFMVDEICGHATEIAQARCGCRVIQRLLEHFPSAQVASLVDELLINPTVLCTHPFANFVMQHILQYASADQQMRVADAISTDVYRLARHAIANN